MKQNDHMSAEEYKALRSETSISTEIRNYLTADGWKVMRINSGRIPSTYTYKTGIRKGITKKRIIQLAEPGTPDIFAFHPLIAYIHGIVALLFVEVKKSGGKPTPLQLAKHEELRAFGAKVIVAHSLAEVQEQLYSHEGSIWFEK